MKKALMAAITVAGLLAGVILPGVINAGGFMGGPCGPPPVPPFIAEKYDADHDGKLSPDEDKAAREAFMKQYDADKDGRLSCEEMKKAGEDMHRAVFDKLDANHDKVLSWDEFKVFMEDCPGGFGPGPGPAPQRGPAVDRAQKPCD